MVAVPSFMTLWESAGAAATLKPRASKQLSGALFILLLLASSDELNEIQRQPRNISNQQQSRKLGHEKRHQALHDAAHRHLEKALADKEVQAEGRREHADGQIDGDDDAEMDEIDAGVLHDRHEKRRQHEHRRARIDEAADDQEKHVDQKKE